MNYNRKKIELLISTIFSTRKTITKQELRSLLVEKFELTRDGALYYCDDFAIRISQRKNTSQQGNTVIAIRKILAYDDIPIISCIISPEEKTLYLINSTFIKKTSHSSQAFEINKIRGSINISDIMKDYDGLMNKPDNFESLFEIHQNIPQQDNLYRIFNATDDIEPSRENIEYDDDQQMIIMEAPKRAMDFLDCYYKDLKDELDERTYGHSDELMLINEKFSSDSNFRGRLIEFFITSNDEKLKESIIQRINKNMIIDDLFTEDKLEDFSKVYQKYYAKVDIKSKQMNHSSQPKAYNIDKMLDFLSDPKSVFLIYVVAIGDDRIDTELISIFQKEIQESTNIQKHWSGRNSRGEAQFNGNKLDMVIKENDINIELEESKAFLEKLINNE